MRNEEYYANHHHKQINKLLYSIDSSAKHTPFCMLLVLVCPNLIIVLFEIINQLLCVLPVYLYIIINNVPWEH